MTRLLEQAFDQLRQQSPEVQDCVAQLVRDTVADETRWHETFGSAQSENWLAGQAAQVRAAIKSGDTTDFDPSALTE